MKGALYLVCMALWRASVATTPMDNGPGEQRKIASTDDVNVLMYGVLQFSEVLHNTYQNTDSKVGRIATTLHHQEGALAQLEKEAKEASHTEELIRHTLDTLQTQTSGLQTQTKQLSGALSLAEQEEAELQSQVTSLEANLQRTIPGKIKALKELALQNFGTLKVLMKWIQDQKQSLEDQNQHLAQLQAIVPEGTPQT